MMKYFKNSFILNLHDTFITFTMLISQILWITMWQVWGFDC